MNLTKMFCNDCKKTTAHKFKAQKCGHVTRIEYECCSCDKHSHIVEGNCVVECLDKCPIMKRKCCSTCMAKVKSVEDLKRRYNSISKTLQKLESDVIKEELRRILKDIKKKNKINKY